MQPIVSLRTVLASALLFNAVALPTVAQQPTLPRMDNARLTLIQPTGPLKLGIPNEVSLTLLGPGIDQVHTVQCIPFKPDHQCGGPLSRTAQYAPVLTRPDGTHFILFIPQVLGRLELIVTAQYPGQVFAEQHVQFEVEPSAPPQRLIVLSLGSGNRNTSWHRFDLDPKESVRSLRLFPQAFYNNVAAPINIPVANVTFAVRSSSGEPVIRFDPATATVEPLRAGQALIESTFIGTKDLTCILVIDPAINSDKSAACHDLLKPGEALAP